MAKKRNSRIFHTIRNLNGFNEICRPIPNQKIQLWKVVNEVLKDYDIVNFGPFIYAETDFIAPEGIKQYLIGIFDFGELRWDFEYDHLLKMVDNDPGRVYDSRALLKGGSL